MTRHSPGSSRDLKALAEHPLISLLDVVPGEGGYAAKAASKLAGADAVARAAQGAEDVSSTAKVSAALNKHGGNRSELGEVMRQLGRAAMGGKAGTAIRGGKAVLAEKLSVSDRVQNMLANLPGGKGIGPAVSSLAEAIQGAGMMSSEMYQWLLDAPTQALKALKPEDVPNRSRRSSTPGGPPAAAPCARRPRRSHRLAGHQGCSQDVARRAPAVRHRE